MAVYTHCCRAQPLRQLGFLVYLTGHCLWSYSRLGSAIATVNYGLLEQDS